MLKSKKQRAFAVLLAVLMLFTSTAPALAHDPFSPFDGETMQTWDADDLPAVFIPLEEPPEGEADPEDADPDDTDPEEAADPESPAPQEEAEAAPFEQQTGKIPLGVSMYRSRSGPVQRASAEIANLYVQWVDGYSYSYELAPGFPVYGMWCIYWVDGHVAYCLEPKKLVSTDGRPLTSTTTWTGLASEQQKAISILLYYGAKDASNIPLHIATQALVWEVCQGYRDLGTFARTSNNIYNGLVSGNAAVASAYGTIESQYRTHATIASFMSVTQSTAPTYTLNQVGTTYTYTLTDTQSVVSDFSFPAISGVTFQVSGNSLTITSDHEIAVPQIVAATKDSQGGGSGDGFVFWLVPGDEQEQVKGYYDGTPDPTAGYFYITTDATAEPPPGPPDDEEYKIKTIKRATGTNELLEGATFQVRHTSHGVVGTITTDSSGRAEITVPWAGTYEIEEISVPAGYVMPADPDQTVYVDVDNPEAEITFFNDPYGSLIVYKEDAANGQRLANATVQIKNISTGNKWSKITDANGTALFSDLEPGSYEVLELRAPDGYVINSQVQTVEVVSNLQSISVTILNEKRAGLFVRKVDPEGKPLGGVLFEFRRGSGEVLLRDVTDANGLIFLGQLDSDTYIVEELAPAPGYLIDENPIQSIKIDTSDPHKQYVLTFINNRRPALEVLKLDEDDPSIVLGGATFRVSEQGGTKSWDIQTGDDGIARLEDLEPGIVYQLVEIQPPPGYVASEYREIFVLEENKTHRITITNRAKPGLMLRKLDATTQQPISGVTFSADRVSGGGMFHVGDFTTGLNGIFQIPDLIEGQYILTETIPAPGYQLDPTPYYVFVEAGKANSVTAYNTPFASLRLVKVDAEKPTLVLGGAVFKLYDAQRLEIGTFQTSSLGEILIPELPAGTFYLQETYAPPGYVLDPSVHKIELVSGKTTTITLKNTQKGSGRLIKRCAETGRGLYNATYLLYDAQNNILGEYTTDQSGQISFGQLTPGTYRVKEISQPPGYVLDETVYTFVIREGEAAELVLTNEPERGRVQVVKVAADDNPITKDKRGNALQHAVFEIYNEDLELMDKIITDRRGLATSDYLPLGRYVMVEVKSPDYYYTDGRPIHFEIKIADDLVRFVVENQPVDIRVTVEKRGILEAMPGDIITYNFSEVANRSNCNLSDFYWRDVLPTDALRIQTLHTGTYNERVSYSVEIKTNLKTTWRTVRSGLLSTAAYTIDLQASALGLAANEYVTEYRLLFGEVGPGFHEDTAPSITCKVLDTLPDGYRFTNKTDVGGKRGKEWAIATDEWTTVIWKPNQPLPKTGA